MATQFTEYDGDMRPKFTDISGATQSAIPSQPINMKTIYFIIVSVFVSFTVGFLISFLWFSGMEQTRNEISRAEEWIDNACGTGMTEHVKTINDNAKVLKDKYKTPYVSKYSNAKCSIPKK